MLSHVFKEIAYGRSLLRICEDDIGMPDEKLVREWCLDPEVSPKYARARELGVHARTERINDLAAMATPETVQVVKLQIDTQKWEATKILPKLYGDRQQIEHTGKIESITVNVTRKEPPK